MKKVIVMAAAVLLGVLGASAQDVQVEQSIKAQSRVEIEVPGQTFNIGLNPVKKDVTTRVAVPANKPKPKPKPTNVRYVNRTQSVTTGYTATGTLEAQKVTANVETTIDAGQIVRIVDGRIVPLEGRVSTLERRMGQVEVDVEAVNRRVDATNTAVNTLAGRVNRQDQVLESYDERIARAETRDPGKGHRWLNTIWNIANTGLSVWALTRSGKTETRIIRGGGNNGGGPIRVCNGVPCNGSGSGSGSGSGTGSGNGWGPIRVN